MSLAIYVAPQPRAPSNVTLTLDKSTTNNTTKRATLHWNPQVEALNNSADGFRIHITQVLSNNTMVTTVTDTGSRVQTYSFPIENGTLLIHTSLLAYNNNGTSEPVISALLLTFTNGSFIYICIIYACNMYKSTQLQCIDVTGSTRTDAPHLTESTIGSNISGTMHPQNRESSHVLSPTGPDIVAIAAGSVLAGLVTGAVAVVTVEVLLYVFMIKRQKK